jgi:chromosome segregation ATPase
LPFLCWAFGVKAQVPEELSSMPETWQLTLDVIKSKAQTLMIENNGLQDEYRQLIGQEQNLQQSISDQEQKNEQMGRFIKERHGQTDQQARIADLTQSIKAKRQQAGVLEGQLGNLARKKTNLDSTIQQLNDAISGIERHQQEEKQQVAPQQTIQPQVDDQLAQLRKQLEDENKQEVVLSNEMDVFKTGDKSQNLNVDAIDEQNHQLEAHLDILRLQKLQYARKSSDAQLEAADRRMYYKIKARKDLLEADISSYETRIDQLKESSLMALSWSLKKKKMIHEMVQADAYNNQIRDKIKGLHEDIDILRDQVARLERRVDFVKGGDPK